MILNPVEKLSRKVVGPQGRVRSSTDDTATGLDKRHQCRTVVLCHEGHHL